MGYYEDRGIPWHIPPPAQLAWDQWNVRPINKRCTICHNYVGRKLWMCLGRPDPAQPGRRIPCPNRHWVCLFHMAHHCSRDVPDSRSIQGVRRGCRCTWFCRCVECEAREESESSDDGQLPVGPLAPLPPPFKAQPAQPPNPAQPSLAPDIQAWWEAHPGAHFAAEQGDDLVPYKAMPGKMAPPAKPWVPHSGGLGKAPPQLLGLSAKWMPWMPQLPQLLGLGKAPPQLLGKAPPQMPWMPQLPQLLMLGPPAKAAQSTAPPAQPQEMSAQSTAPPAQPQDRRTIFVTERKHRDLKHRDAGATTDAERWHRSSCRLSLRRRLV